MLLERSAASAFARRAYAAAASAFQAAALLSQGDEDRVRRVMGAGRALWFAGERERAAALLESVLDLASEPTARADLQQLRGLAMLLASPVSETHAMLVAEADRVEPHDGTRASALRAIAALTYYMAGDHADADEIARHALAKAGPGARPTVAMVLALVTAAGSGQVDEALALLEPMLERLEAIDPLGELWFVLSGTAQSLGWIEQWAHAREICSIASSARRARRARQGRPGLSPSLVLRVRAPARQDRGGIRCRH